ncbi:MAG: 16S rRNA (cytidine(1402)-2'-O)-methyltransferase [Bacteriovoracaceae bacterium]|nr:16S rRNA (cytidine(1402)-2'-O)-methyltransferase [Bacteriovoracaceae bacterium]
MSLYLIGLPIGEAKDVTFRVKEILEGDHTFLAEDTRTFKSLLNFLKIDISNKKFISYHEHSKEKTLSLVQDMKGGKDYFLVSDAGSPIISDPAYPLVREAIAQNVEIHTMPGVCSPIVALELSGLPPHPFTFHGFLSRENKKIKDLFHHAKDNGGTHIVFESPHRIIETLNNLKETVPHADVCLCRELTKTYESVYRFKASEFGEVILDQMTIKGEMILLFYVKPELNRKGTNDKIFKLAEACLQKNGQKKPLAKLLGEIMGKDSKELYKSLSNN